MIERRKNARTDLALRVYFVCLSEDGRETTQDVGTVLNISESGLMLETPVPILTKAIKIMASLQEKSGLEVMAELIYSMQLAPDKIRSGLSFTGDPDQVQRFVAGLRGFINN
ncbi:MAG: PilZ domain-containing protein [Deltaproteobacteria bacterium]|jgi:hypothetical protein